MNYFILLKGSLLFEIEGQESFTMNQGDFFIVKKGINHRVSSKEECKIMLIENKTTAHTGNIKSKVTKSIEQQLL
jgi:quercetin dioxygenase-like cupin family protein